MCKKKSNTIIFNNKVKNLFDTNCQTWGYISEDDWNNYYSDSFSSRDLLNLKKEIKKYKLDNVITIDDNDYKIICYGDLETKFVDDLTKNNLDKEKINMDLIV